MKFSTVVSGALLAASQLVSAQYNNQSAPFSLVLLSDNSTVNGSYLSACHEGAAIEGLCLGNSISVSQPSPIKPSAFYFNYSDSVVTPNASIGTTGYLTYLLIGGNFEVSEPLGLDVDPTSNVALPLFYPGTNYATPVAFDQNNFLNIQGYVDDRVSPPKSGPTTAYYRWFACTTYYTGYTYNTLSWVLGAAEPENPTCTKVSVKRVFNQ